MISLLLHVKAIRGNAPSVVIPNFKLSKGPNLANQVVYYACSMPWLRNSLKLVFNYLWLLLKAHKLLNILVQNRYKYSLTGGLPQTNFSIFPVKIIKINLVATKIWILLLHGSNKSIHNNKLLFTFQIHDSYKKKHINTLLLACLANNKATLVI